MRNCDFNHLYIYQDIETQRLAVIVNCNAKYSISTKLCRGCLFIGTKTNIILTADNPPPLNCLTTAQGYDYRGHQTKTKSGLRCQDFAKRHVSSYIALYPGLMSGQSGFHFTSLFTQTPSRLLWQTSCQMLQLMSEGCSYTYPQLYIAR